MKNLLLLLTALLMGAMLHAQDTLNTFHPVCFSGNSLKFQLSLPQKPTEHPALLVYLHGAGERGTGNYIQLKHFQKLFAACGNTALADSVLILAPECPENTKWVDVDWKDTIYHFPDSINLQSADVMRAIDSLVQQYGVDRNRIYLVGMSMGGLGVINLAGHYPKTFAGIVCVCGGVDFRFKKLANENIWFFHGTDDKLVRPKSVKEFVNMYARKEGNIISIMYEGVGHNAWDYAFKDCNLLPWLMSKTLKNK
ncbi:MAG: prolyl oligopeptidase family serine peptidase [Chitinophagales bacterium]